MALDLAPGEICALSRKFGAPCVACPEGECVPVRLEALTGVYEPVDLVASCR